MAGKKEKKAKKDGKKTSFLPKVIDGIKLPKDARRQLTALAKHPVIADLLASGLVALAHRIKGDGAKTEEAPATEPEAAPAPAATEAAATPAKPAVKRIRKPATAAAPAEAAPAAKPAPVRRTRKPTAAKPAAAAEPVAAPAATEAKPAKVAKAPPPRRTRKKADTTAKPRTRRTPPKTES
ncbi:RNA polymerase primary sigma factor [Sphingomonas sp. NFR04]|uniref:hypothetical protein n=1 Tax=Sphingomonas sp. NFR04 TaxID=1566283 RepID=UPI0008E1370C|nr:hypothetical protein [Sphingomonas sp. NFR04]SFJ27637.1 RNA polymerase primary sigma factor [Sphingomonas sp. NFR04]